MHRVGTDRLDHHHRHHQCQCLVDQFQLLPHLRQILHHHRHPSQERFQQCWRKVFRSRIDQLR